MSSVFRGSGGFTTVRRFEQQSGRFKPATKSYDCGEAAYLGYAPTRSTCMHKPPPEFSSWCRETEATSNLSGILTVSCLVTMFVIRQLGLALGQIDSQGGWSQSTALPDKQVKPE